MLGNCDKMVLISSNSPNQWPQMKNHPPNLDHDHHHQKGLNLMSSSSIMEKQQLAPSQDHQIKPPSQQQQQQQQQEPLRCPRCDSSNTKFCYYNNYSLSQPRHFCKACKRYWTRGGTLRSVPVGGGCRKNKRIKRPTTATTAARSSSSPAPDSTSSSSTSNNNTNPLHGNVFYGSASDLNVPFSGYDHHHHNHQLNALGLGFSSANIDNHHREFHFSGFNSSSLLSGYSSLFGNNPSANSNSISSLLASKFTNNNNGGGVDGSNNLFENLASPPFDLVHGMESNGGDHHQLGLNNIVKDVKLEDGMKRLNWDHHPHHQNQTDDHQIVVTQSNNDPNSLYGNWSSQTWNDPTNLGSSITSSLI